MGDEPRRSVRATKGQHTKSLDQLDQPSEVPKKRGKKAAAAKKAASQEAQSAEEEEEEEEEEIIRCICGTTEQDDDSDESWIACETCTAWQHNVCMGVTTDEAILKDMDYYCEQCRPEDHKILLDSMARADDPPLWEQRRHEFEQAELEAQKVKKGKKGKGKRISDQKTEPEQNGKAKAKSQTPVPTPDTKKNKKEPLDRTGSTKRKAADGSQEDSAKAKVRKTTPQLKGPLLQPAATPSDIPATIGDLGEKVRQGVATLVYKNLRSAIKNAQRSGIYKATDIEVDQNALRLALEIERAIQDTQSTLPLYTAQGRKIGANLKSNQELCDQLLSKTLVPRALAVMTDDEMASKELQRATAEMKARAEKQSIMLTDDGPRVRRTHKGEEVIEQDNTIVPSDETAASRRRSMIDPNQGMGARSREGSVGDGPSELPMDIDDYRSQDDIRGNAAPSYPLSINTTPVPQRKPSQSGDFDINKVFSSVKSPTVSQPAQKPPVTHGPPRAGPGEDKDIDRMLQDGNDSPPYSPKDDVKDPSIIWQGSLVMNSVADFKANARHIGGADFSTLGVKWENLVPDRLAVAGRIDPEKANEYLCSLRYSQPSDVVVLSLEPRGANGATEFKKLVDYFLEKKRYGVVGTKNNVNVRDTYLIPVQAGAGGTPEFLMNFPNNKVPEERQESMMLVTLVVRDPQLQQLSAAYNFDGASSPSIVGHPQRQMSLGGYSGPQMSPINQQGSFGSPVASQQSQPTTAEQQQAEYDRQRAEAQVRGEGDAREILGPLIDAPTVGFLMPQAFMMKPKEWTIIKEILVEEPRSRDDLKFLSELLEKKNADSGPAAASTPAAKA